MTPAKKPMTFGHFMARLFWHASKGAAPAALALAWYGAPAPAAYVLAGAFCAVLGIAGWLITVRLRYWNERLEWSRVIARALDDDPEA